MYNADNYGTVGSINLPFRGPANYVDMAACCLNRCVYLADPLNKCIVRLLHCHQNGRGASGKWMTLLVTQ